MDWVWKCKAYPLFVSIKLRFAKGFYRQNFENTLLFNDKDGLDLQLYWKVVSIEGAYQWTFANFFRTALEHPWTPDSEAVVRMCSVKKVFLKILQNKWGVEF